MFVSNLIITNNGWTRETAPLTAVNCVLTENQEEHYNKDDNNTSYPIAIAVSMVY